MAIIAPDIGIDLGTSNTLVHVRGRGIQINEPTLCIMTGGDRRTVKAIGQDALALAGRTTGGDVAVRPLADGTVKDFDLTESVLRYFLRKAIGVSHLVKPRLYITVPSRISPVERRVIREAAASAGVRKNAIHLIDKPFAAAYGSGLPVFQPEGSMVVDIGGGTTEVSVIALGGTVLSKSIPVAGIRMDAVIVEFIKHDHNMLIGDRMAEDIKIDWGSALPVSEERKVVVRGRDLITGLPQTAEISSNRFQEALHNPCVAILSAIREVLDKTPPELCGDILRKGIFLVGGGAQLYSLDRFLAGELGLPVTLARDPMLCAAAGVGYMAENAEILPKLTRGNFLRDDKA